MNKNLILASLGALALAGCTTSAWVSPVEVTRFVGSSPAELGRGTISIAAAPGLAEAPIEFALYREALAAELTMLGYQVIDAQGGQIATLAINEAVNQPEQRRPVSVGGGAGIGSYGSGVGLGLGIDLTPRRADEIERQVAVTIRPAAACNNLWEGRARFVATANHEQAQPALAATRALSALFAGFPGNSGETVEVE
jgi:hypothetical protein